MFFIKIQGQFKLGQKSTDIMLNILRLKGGLLEQDMQVRGTHHTCERSSTVICLYFVEEITGTDYMVWIYLHQVKQIITALC